MTKPLHESMVAYQYDASPDEGPHRAITVCPPGCARCEYDRAHPPERPPLPKVRRASISDVLIWEPIR